MGSLRTVLPTAALGLLLSSCVTLVTPPGVSIATTPPGARVYVDGRDSGFVTPCVIDLREEENYWVQLRMSGYATTDLYLQKNLRVQVVPWTQGEIAPHDGWWFPIFLPAVDLFLPVQIDQSPSPKRIHVRMRPAAVG
ncbi:MAG: PEGA domain-containing protein [Planctomycetota bacterium]|nr:PEGA domain-containing protein [Planctomycetota bacterium]